MTSWIQWQGGAENLCPLPEHIWCDVLMLDSEIFSDFAGEFNWSDLGEWGGNIIAYRVPKLSEIKLSKKMKEKI